MGRLRIEFGVEHKVQFSNEQLEVIKAAKRGDNLYIDACIGSGKTTLLNGICKEIPWKKTLYLTYNKLLKEDARKQIVENHVEVQNYHGLVYKFLTWNNYTYTHQTGIKEFVKLLGQGAIRIPKYELILVDEYQDINDDACNLILAIDKYLEGQAQLIFVGDLKQKIYDTTTVNVLEDCIFKLRDNYTKLDLTQCFRLNEEHAGMLGNIWNKNIKGINKTQEVVEMPPNMQKLKEILDQYETKDILILTPFRNNSILNLFINDLERLQPEKYNKKTLYVTISDKEDSNKPVDNSMIVTTFDGSKGLERKLCIVFGFHGSSLSFRSMRGNKNIMKNLYLVAASRGKEKIIFITDINEELLNEQNFSTYLLEREMEQEFHPSEMFDFAFDTDIEKTFECLEIKELPQPDTTEIVALQRDHNILLSPVVGIYQEAMFFKDWSFERKLNQYKEEKPLVKYVRKIGPKSIKKQVLCLTAIETDLTRYANQAIEEFIDSANETRLYKRLHTHLDPNDKTQLFVSTQQGEATIGGYVDAVVETFLDSKNPIPFELKFVEELDRRHFLQIATYVYCGEFEFGILWNTRYNQMYKVSIKNREQFIALAIRTAMKLKKGDD